MGPGNRGIMMSTTNLDSTGLPDLQNQEDTRGVHLPKVGIRNYRTPLTVLTKDGDVQNTTAAFSLYTNVSEEVKGSNMSRFSQTIEKALKHGESVSVKVIKEIVYIMREKLGSTDAYCKIRFPFYVKKKAPTTDNWAWSVYDSCLEARLIGSGEKDDYHLFVSTDVDYMSVCPCSKEMSLVGTNEDGAFGRGAHYQRSIGRLTVHAHNPAEVVWLEDMIKVVEDQASCPIYNVLKRPDEKYVTEHGYKNSKFTEDVSRDVAIEMKDFPNVDGFVFVSEHLESIHQYDAVSIVRGGEYHIP